ncbi:outer membrane beta-barrel protein [Arthrospiribacter ruber]|uniref:PorT family protein n=1 Tax=Arthrospiribacter ruber TaxID=2487934 RepID=A0A951MAN1_9BACT|nr:outer membrane beta-barrel protein [Arthrospiribacter ruber]MBW3466719.1 PorT family protein [Arthrospiribacter ruber]
MPKNIQRVLLFLCLFVFLISHSGLAQEIEEESEEEDETEEPIDSDFFLSNIPFFLYDVMITGGLNTSNVYWSNHYRELNPAGGFQIGLEGYFPLGQVSFIDYGVQFAQRNFRHGSQSILFKNNYLDFPLYASFSLPEFITIDWRFFLGTQFSYRLSTTQSEDYLLFNQDRFEYDPQRFNRFDTGMTFGLSGERNNIYFRLRSFVGISKIDRLDQGAMSSFNLELGYFLFRNYRQ